MLATLVRVSYDSRHSPAVDRPTPNSNELQPRSLSHAAAHAATVEASWRLVAVTAVSPA